MDLIKLSLNLLIEETSNIIRYLVSLLKKFSIKSKFFSLLVLKVYVYNFFSSLLSLSVFEFHHLETFFKSFARTLRF